MNVILIDNFDSFSYNLVDLLRSAGMNVAIYRNDIELEFLDKIIRQDEQNICMVLSPGPGKPSDAGNLLPIIQKFKKRIPIIGICLGHQAIAQCLGGVVCKSDEVVHGKFSLMNITNHQLFDGLKETMPVARYHSLKVDALTDMIEVLVRIDDVPMVIICEEYKMIGFQFHPESIMTLDGDKILKNAVKYFMGRKNA